MAEYYTEGYISCLHIKENKLCSVEIVPASPYLIKEEDVKYCLVKRHEQETEGNLPFGNLIRCVDGKVKIELNGLDVSSLVAVKAFRCKVRLESNDCGLKDIKEYSIL